MMEHQITGLNVELGRVWHDATLDRGGHLIPLAGGPLLNPIIT